MLWKKSGEKWTDEELVPVNKVLMVADDIYVKFVKGVLKMVKHNN